MLRSKTILYAVYLTLALLTPLTATAFEPPIVPDQTKTPGDVLTTDKDTICAKGYTKTVRDVPEFLKEQIYRSYGITERKAGEYEIDHLTSLELGGSNSALNLWPQSYETQPLNAHVKDKLENRMHSLICSGKLDIKQAQDEIAKDWIGAYQKYVGPLPGATATTTPAPDGDMSATGQHDQSGGCPDSMPVKVSNSGIYHVPGGSFYNRTTHIKACFATPADAEAAGYRASKR
jgi:hypothetical protein